MQQMKQPSDLLKRLIAHRAKATPEEVGQLRQQAAQADFCHDLLEVDEVLWGGFWHFDVISPGYSLPAVELNLLRGMRLDHTWPEGTSVEQYLADLRRAIMQPQAGLWTLLVVGEPCAVFVARGQPMMTVVWYCGTTGQLHAGYRTTKFRGDSIEGAVEQRKMMSGAATFSPKKSPDWLEQAIAEKNEVEPNGLAAYLDMEILRWRQQMA